MMAATQFSLIFHPRNQFFIPRLIVFERLLQRLATLTTSRKKQGGISIALMRPRILCLSLAVVTKRYEFAFELAANHLAKVSEG